MLEFKLNDPSIFEYNSLLKYPLASEDTDRAEARKEKKNDE